MFNRGFRYSSIIINNGRHLRFRYIFIHKFNEIHNKKSSALNNIDDTDSFDVGINLSQVQPGAGRPLVSEGNMEYTPDGKDVNEKDLLLIYYQGSGEEGKRNIIRIARMEFEEEFHKNMKKEFPDN